MHSAVPTFESWRDRFKERIARDRQRMTPQRELIAQILFDNNHLNVDELHQKVRLQDGTVGYATVYRTLKLLERYDLVHSSHFGDGTARYEVNVGAEEHHDHMICTDCGTIVEFENEAIERLQEQVAHQLGFRLTSHRMDLHGICPGCQAKEKARDRARRR